jgi:hypothetical protein
MKKNRGQKSRATVPLMISTDKWNLIFAALSAGFRMSSKLTQEQIDELKKNPFFDKYADKIAKLQK